MTTASILAVDPGTTGAAVMIEVQDGGKIRPFRVDLDMTPDAEMFQGACHFWNGYPDAKLWESCLNARDAGVLRSPEIIVLEGQAPHGGDTKRNTLALNALHRTVGQWQGLFMALWPNVPVAQPQWSNIKTALNTYNLGAQGRMKHCATWEADRQRVEASALRRDKGSELKVAGYWLATSLEPGHRAHFINSNNTFIDGRTDALALGVGAWLADFGRIRTGTRHPR